MPLVYSYDPLELICACHNVKFIRYEYIREYSQRNRSQRSYGCPVCVGLIRAKVQLEFKRGSTFHIKRYPKNAKRKTGRPKNANSQQTSSATSIASHSIDHGNEL
jgi:hypothetical protein